MISPNDKVLILWDKTNYGKELYNNGELKLIYDLVGTVKKYHNGAYIVEVTCYIIDELVKSKSQTLSFYVDELKKLI